jgi:hypothetical protein
VSGLAWATVAATLYVIDGFQFFARDFDIWEAILKHRIAVGIETIAQMPVGLGYVVGMTS